MTLGIMLCVATFVKIQNHVYAEIGFYLENVCS